MSPIGETLKAAREEKGLGLDRVSEETNIAKRFLMALETEDFGVFPGDPYAIGFLRNYADYLGLPADDLVATFRNLRIQEQPVPIQDLIPKRGPSKNLIIAGAAGGALLLILIIVLVAGGRKANDGLSVKTQRGPLEYRVDGATFEHRLYVGDTLTVKSGADSYRVLLSSIEDGVYLETPMGKNKLMLGEEAAVDLDRNGSPEVKVLVSDFAKKDPSKGAVVKVSYINPGDSLQAATQSGQAAPADKAPDAAAQAAPAAPTPPPAPATAGRTGILFESSKTSYPFVLSVTFRGPCMFRYEADKRDRDERYYHKGDTITVNANNSVKIWASNAQFVKLTVQASGGKTADVDLGSPGEVAVKRIAWSQSDSGGYALGIADVD